MITSKIINSPLLEGICGILGGFEEYLQLLREFSVDYND
jgi:hypothetical protein